MKRAGAMFKIIVILVLGYGNSQFPDIEYCSIPCASGRHTMCAYEPFGENCIEIEDLMSPESREKILSLHNLFRNAVAGGKHPSNKDLKAPSSNMRQMYWDFELEGIAERWASQCNVTTNDDCRDVARFAVGQVMSKSRILAGGMDYYDTLFNTLWFSELENLSRNTISKYSKHRNLKHVAQILNANTMRIGCADVITRGLRSVSAIRVTICNYGPAITSGEEIYKIGKPCSECPAGTKCRGPFSKYPHLCSEFRQFDIAEVKPDKIKPDSVQNQNVRIKTQTVNRDGDLTSEEEETVYVYSDIPGRSRFKNGRKIPYQMRIVTRKSIAWNHRGDPKPGRYAPPNVPVSDNQQVGSREVLQGGRSLNDNDEYEQYIDDNYAQIRYGSRQLGNGSINQPGRRQMNPGQNNEGKPGEVKPGEVKPGEVKPGEVKPGEVKPDPGKPGEVKPDPGKPGEVKPDPGKPDPGKPDPGKPDPGKPDPGKPDPGKPDPGITMSNTEGGIAGTDPLLDGNETSSTTASTIASSIQLRASNWILVTHFFFSMQLTLNNVNFFFQTMCFVNSCTTE